MKYTLRIVVTLVLITSGFSSSVIGQQRNPRARTVRRSRTAPVVRETNVRAHMEFLASDALQGRGSGTQYELIAGQYIASQLRQFGIAPAGDGEMAGRMRSYIQAVKITNRTFTEAPTLDFNTNGTPTRLTHGQEMLIGRINAPQISGPLQKIDASGKPRRGAMVFVTAGDAQRDLKTIA
ncbi:MAG: hypothetical protein WKF84_04260 [Pyrinomonadaceae bacterium]